MIDKSDTVFPVPEGISSMQWPWTKQQKLLDIRKTATAKYLSNVKQKTLDYTKNFTNLGIEGSFQFQHVRVLFRVDVLIWKVNN